MILKHNGNYVVQVIGLSDFIDKLSVKEPLIFIYVSANPF